MDDGQGVVLIQLDDLYDHATGEYAPPIEMSLDGLDGQSALPERPRTLIEHYDAQWTPSVWPADGQ
jgi:hypothetical protein